MCNTERTKKKTHKKGAQEGQPVPVSYKTPVVISHVVKSCLNTIIKNTSINTKNMCDRVTYFVSVHTFPY